MKGTVEAAIILGVDYEPDSMDYFLKFKENEQEAPELNPHYGIYEQIPTDTCDHTDAS